MPPMEEVAGTGRFAKKFAAVRGNLNAGRFDGLLLCIAVIMAALGPPFIEKL